MRDFIFLHHNDGPEGVQQDWAGYLSKLKASGRFEGGSGIGNGACVRKTGKAAPVSEHIGGYIRVQAHDLEDAKTLLSGNPVYESGGTVEIRELPRD
jgi:hypothetical protein